MRSLTLLLAVGLAALGVATPTALAEPDIGPGPCICDPQPCGTPPSPLADPNEWTHDVVCNLLGGEPW